MIKLITGTLLFLAASTAAVAGTVEKTTIEIEVACIKGQDTMEEWIIRLNEYYGEVPVFVGEENGIEGQPNNTHVVITRSEPMKTFSVLIGGETGTCIVTSGAMHGLNDVPGHKPTKEFPKNQEKPVEPEVPFLYNNSDPKTLDS